MSVSCVRPAEFYLPPENCDWSRWACIACDQFTSEPSYWEEVSSYVGNTPSAFRLILPECYLAQEGKRIPAIHAAMRRYLEEGILTPRGNGYILTERTTPSGTRLGLLATLDLECYDYRPHTNAPVRATEETIESRIPSRVKIRRGAPLELPHVLLLMNDAEDRLLCSLHEHREQFQKLYDFELMQGGGHLRGYALFSAEEQALAETALASLPLSNGLAFAVGDGNHSLASAKAYWEELKAGLSPEEVEHHPARFALVELVSLHSKALLFAPIHRVLFHADAEELLRDWANWLENRKEANVSLEGQVQLLSEKLSATLSIPKGELPVAVLQAFLDEWLKRHPEASIDYIHGDESLKKLCQAENTIGFLLPDPDKNGLFESVARSGSLPRKTFSMGNAREKRYYLEARKLIP